MKTITIICIIICIFLIGCAGPHTLRFLRTDGGTVITTDPEDKDIFGKQKALPKGMYKAEPTEQGMKCETDFKPDYKFLEVVVNKNALD